MCCCLFVAALWPWFDGNPLTVFQGLVMTMVVGLAFGVVPLVLGWALVKAGRISRERWNIEHEVWRRAKAILGGLRYCVCEHVVYDPFRSGPGMTPGQAPGYACRLAAAPIRP